MLKRVRNKFYRIFFYINNAKKYRKLGKNTLITKPMLISGKKNISLGNNILIRNNARIEVINDIPENIEKIIIEDDCCIEQGLHLTAAYCVHIHENVLIAPYVYITDCMHEYENIGLPVMKQGLKIAKTEIGENTWIGIGAKIFAGVHIGKNCVIGANSAVINNIPDYSVAVGSPAKVIKQYNFDTQKWERV